MMIMTIREDATTERWIVSFFGLDGSMRAFYSALC